MTRPIVTAEEKKYNATRFCTSPRPEREATNVVFVARANAFLKQAKKNVVMKANKKHNDALKKACNELQLIKNDEGEVEYVPSSPCYCP
jgi:hypothetical protein